VGDTDIYPIPGFSEPFSALTHLVGAGVFALLGVHLLWLSRGSAARVVSLAIYIFSCVFLLSMSGVFHLLAQGGMPRYVLQRLDHAAIFLLIAGTFTPVTVMLFRGVWRWAILLVIWSAAVTAITLKSIYFHEVQEWLSVSLYLAMGWFGVLAGFDLWRRFGLRFIRGLLCGGLAYTVGAVMDFLRWPTLVPGIVGPHETFHVLVLAGAAFHWTFIVQCVAEAAV
jgi:channel protein (hemolysin III family)